MGFTLFPLVIHKMKQSRKNWLLQDKPLELKQKVIVILLLLFSLPSNSQVVNFVNNGGFEIPNPSNLQKPKYWDAFDTTKFMGILLSQTITPFLVPNSSYTYQWPKEGSNFLIGTQYMPSCSSGCIGYPKNRLKQSLVSGKTYCFKMYTNLSNESTHAIDSHQVFFTDSSNDTIKYCTIPLTYLTPQISYTTGYISDTLNWTLIQGTYIANGNETYIVLGNFKSAPSTNTLLVNPKNMPTSFSVYSYDAVSLIDIDLPAFAGRDTFFIPGDSIYLGRLSDVGIDEACMWYKLPNTTTAIDTVAGFWLKPTTTCTYVVKQDICGNIKYDTIVLYQSAIGINELNLISNNLKIYPQPTSNEITIQLNLQMDNPFNKYRLYDNLGQLIREEELNLNNNSATINVQEIENGVYSIFLVNNKNESVTKKLVITR